MVDVKQSIAVSIPGDVQPDRRTSGRAGARVKVWLRSAWRATGWSSATPRLAARAEAKDLGRSLSRIGLPHRDIPERCPRSREASRNTTGGVGAYGWDWGSRSFFSSVCRVSWLGWGTGCFFPRTCSCQSLMQTESSSRSAYISLRLWSLYCSAESCDGDPRNIDAKLNTVPPVSGSWTAFRGFHVGSIPRFCLSW